MEANVHAAKGARSFFRGRFFAAWAPAVLLLAVVSVHLLRSRTDQLIPWLGGGFGMFATFDKYWAPALSCEGQDANGGLYTVAWAPVEVGGAQGAVFKTKLISRPNRRDLEQAGDVILHAPLARAYFTPAQMVHALSADGVLDRVEFRPPLGELTKTIPLATGASRVDPNGTNPLVWVRLQVWRLAFDSARARVYLRPAGEPVEVRRQP